MATQVLPTAQSHFSPYPSSYDSNMFATLPHFEDLHAGDYQSYQPYQPNQPEQQLYLISRPGSSMAEGSRRPSLSPTMQMRQPSRRDRTPIRRNRVSVSRPRSHSRSELVMAYAIDQEREQPAQAHPAMSVIPSQSAPTTPQIFNTHPTSVIQPGAASYSDSTSYFPSTMSPPGSLSEYDYAPDPQFQGYYNTGRSMSQATPYGMTLDPQQTMYLPPSQQPQQRLPPTDAPVPVFPPVPMTLESSRGDIEILPSRPKPACYDHGCNGRQFSTFSNLLRHQREKSGSAMKATCPYCGTEFTRTTARNGHMYGGKCKGKPESEKEPSEAGSATSKSSKGKR